MMAEHAPTRPRLRPRAMLTGPEPVVAIMIATVTEWDRAGADGAGSSPPRARARVVRPVRDPAPRRVVERLGCAAAVWFRCDAPSRQTLPARTVVVRHASRAAGPPVRAHLPSQAFRSM